MCVSKRKQQSPTTVPSRACENVTIGMGSTSFIPASVTVQYGDTITWVWPSKFLCGRAYFDSKENKDSNVFHQVSSTDTSFLCDANGRFGTGNPTKFPFNYTITVNSANGFDAPGTYHYVCSIHCLFGMRGTVTVANACLGQSFPTATTTTTATTPAAAATTSSRSSTIGTTVPASAGFVRVGFVLLWLLVLMVSG